MQTTAWLTKAFTPKDSLVCPTRPSRTAGWLAAALGTALALSLFSGCAPGINELAHTAGAKGTVAGFWLGLWHGMIVVVTFVISLFSEHVRMYEVHNNGAWYNLGYLLGLCMSLGGSSHGAARRSTRQRPQRPGKTPVATDSAAAT